MNRTISLRTSLTLLFSVLWLAFLVTMMATAGPMDTFDRVLEWTARSGVLYTLTYINAALVTLSATGLFAALFNLVRHAMPTRAMVGLAFVPAYCVINLVVYLSQVTVVPALYSQLSDPAAGGAARMLLMLTIQQWPGSSMAFFNILAYGLLGIPSIIYGAALARQPGAVRAGGVLLALNGILCIVAVTGSLVNLPVLTIGSLLGGVLFIAALPFLLLGLRD